MGFRQLKVEDLDSLRRRAHDYFRDVDRPVPSPELARILFRVDPPEDHVSPLLIRTLLRRDERFRELSRGTWDLVGARYHDMPLEESRFAVVDIEATGSNPREDHVIEVGLVVLEGLEVVDRFSTLVQPEVRIPDWIQRLTGIDESTVQNAPRFHQVVPDLLRRIDGSVFVAHNVDFDYRFLRQQIKAAGHNITPWPTLCTVRLARRALPGLDSYRLDALAASLELGLDRHHRAVDDAEATARLLQHIAARMTEERGVETVGELLGLAHGRIPAKVRRAAS